MTHKHTDEIETSHWDLFYYTESNHHHPIKDADAKCVSIDYTATATVHEVITFALDNNLIPRGSSRCGVTEVHVDDGIHMRVGPNRYSGNKGASKFQFKSWEDMEEAEDLGVDYETETAASNSASMPDRVHCACGGWSMVGKISSKHKVDCPEVAER